MRARSKRPPTRPWRHRLILVAPTALIAYVACAAPPAPGVIPTTIQPGTTSVSVDPEVFLGTVECSTLPNSMQSFVATVTDQTGRFVLPSSPPTSCSQSAYFENIIVGDVFTAEIDGYELPADQLVPICGAPPPGDRPTSCHADADCQQTHPNLTPAPDGTACMPDGTCGCRVDSDCPAVYGCQGRCLVSLFLNEDFSCLQTCVGDTDAGSAQIAAFAACVAKADPAGNGTGNCASTSLPQYLACIHDCELSSRNAPATDDQNVQVMSCIAASNDCVLSNIPELQQPCGTVPGMQKGGIPNGGVADGGAAGGGDLVLSGEVQSCGCVYPVAEGGRTMYQIDKPSTPVTPRWTAPFLSIQAPLPLCGQSNQPMLECCSDSDCPAGRLCQLDEGSCKPPNNPPGHCDLEAQAYMNVSLTPCQIGDNAGSSTPCNASETDIQVLVSALLAGAPEPQPGAPKCVGNTAGAGTGTVTRFDVIPLDPTVVASTATSAGNLGVTCSSTSSTTPLGVFTGGADGLGKGFNFSQGVTPGKCYGFKIIGYDGSSTKPAYSACCFATAQCGDTVSAMCDPLTPTQYLGPDGGLVDQGVVDCASTCG